MKVRANLNFDAFRQGKVYDIGDDSLMAALVGVGYLTEISDDTNDNVDNAPVSGDDVVVSTPPKRKRKVNNGPSEVEQGGEDSHSPEAHHTTSGPDNR